MFKVSDMIDGIHHTASAQLGPHDHVRTVKLYPVKHLTGYRLPHHIGLQMYHNQIVDVI